MPSTLIYGLPGKGKSLFMIQYALTVAEKYEKPIVSNFYFRPTHLAQLAKMMNLEWILNNIDKGILYYINPNYGFQDLLLIPDSVVLIDEVAMYAPKKDGGTPMAIRNALKMSRKLSQYTVFSCQYPNQVDDGIKDYADEIFYCQGVTAWSKTLRNEHLIIKDVKRFTSENFKVWFGDPKLRRNPIKSKLLAAKQWYSLLSCIDAMTFEAYESFVDFRKLSISLPDNDAFKEASTYPYCNLENSKKHSLDYWPHEYLILPPVSQDSIDSLFNNASQYDEEEDIYSQIQSGRYNYDLRRRRPSKREIEEEIYNRPRSLLVWRVWGRNNIKLHKYSGFMSKIYTKSYKFLPSLLKLDKLLYKIIVFNMYTLELKAIKWAFIVLIVLTLIPIIF